MKFIVIFLFACLAGHTALPQRLWTKADQQYQLDNLRRTRAELIKETEHLTDEQWHFRESPDRWSIGEIVEHLGYWEMLFARDVSMAMRPKAAPELNQTCAPDSVHFAFIMEEAKHISPDFSRPLGFMRGKDNLRFFLKLRNEHIGFLEKTDADLRAYFQTTAPDRRRSVHQMYIVMWGHCDRHMRQILRVKAHPNYPKASQLTTQR
ncbi:hypothetical protein GCM10023189_51410 [Nibrella saemangeumensis]|uniref:DinB-like domain-containing protein n=1 Tax=Nibrella saemangeumensis TaxID=1084526 RepID=A0ABP8NID2_9BACT